MAHCNYAADPESTLPLIRELLPGEATERQWKRCHALHRAANTEHGTHNPLSPQAYRAAHRPANGGLASFWVAWQCDEAVAKVDLRISAEHPQRADIGMVVRPELRRMGLGRQLALLALERAADQGARQAWVSALHATGYESCEKLGGELVHQATQRFLTLADADWDVVHRWRRQARGQHRGSSVQHFRRLPEELAPAFLDTLNRSWSLQPGPAEFVAQRMTLAAWRAQEQQCEDRGWDSSTLVCRGPDGAVRALTSGMITPTVLRQQFTGVRPEDQGLGLGKWLKAELLLRTRARHPDVERLCTQNATTNAPMAAINQRLGFADVVEHRLYRFDVDGLRQRLR